jgi:hypothetical protein
LHIFPLSSFFLWSPIERVLHFSTSFYFLIIDIPALAWYLEPFVWDDCRIFWTAGCLTLYSVLTLHFCLWIACLHFHYMFYKWLLYNMLIFSTILLERTWDMKRSQLMKFPMKNLKKNLKMKILSVHYNKKSLQYSFVHLQYSFGHCDIHCTLLFR